jgi:predicted branched-subunit amino acid permease
MATNIKSFALAACGDIPESDELSRLAVGSLLKDPLFKSGFSAVTAGVVGTGIWGVVTALAMMKSGLSTWECVAMTLLVYSGTAQLAALPLIAAGAPLITIVATAVLVSLRFVVYSAIVAKHFGHFPLMKRLMIGYLTIDSGLAAYTTKNSPTWNSQQQLSFWAGCNLPVWVFWQVGSLIGIVLAGHLPTSKAYAFIGLLAILAMTTPLIKSKATIACAVTAAAVAIVGVRWPTGVATFVAVILGVGAAMLFPNQPSAQGEAK